MTKWKYRWNIHNIPPSPRFLSQWLDSRHNWVPACAAKSFFFAGNFWRRIQRLQKNVMFGRCREVIRVKRIKKYWVGRGSDNLFRRQKASSVQLNQADLVQSSQWKNLLMISPYFYHVRIRISWAGTGPQQFGRVVEGLMIPLDIGDHALHVYWTLEPEAEQSQSAVLFACC